MDDKDVVELLLHAYEMIEQDRMDEVYPLLSKMTAEHPEWVDERFQAELKLLTKQMEDHLALKEFGFLRSVSLAYRYCDANYAKDGMLTGENTGEKELLPERDTIWWCWLQGIEKAPDLVKRCYDSLSKLGKKILVLDEGNLKDYVQLPAFVEEKYQRGMIERAHYTDLVRLELLTKRGGIWIDATTFISGTEQILPVLDEENLFFYRSGNVSEYIIFDNWFMMAKRKSAILEATKRMLYRFWEQEEKVKHYFIFHLMMSIACKQNPQEYAIIPAFSNEPAHILQYELGKPFQKRRWQQILTMSDVHKLTYKLEEQDYRGSFLEHILQQGAE
ncbi:MAG: capsular polysaccharide synthesis protein [Lachnospiraceae bacterium]|nr:capsular polysaccharide synthesis protein [Lachnospiraceae bacterium]